MCDIHTKLEAAKQSEIKKKCVELHQQVFCLLLMEGSLVNKTDLRALNLSETYCHKTGTRTPSCAKPQQPTICNSNTGGFFNYQPSSGN